jgi:hypothetical protein
VNIANIGVGVFADLSKLSSGLQEGQSAVAAFAGIAATAFSAVAAAATTAGLAIDDALDGIRVSTGATGQALASLEDSFDRVFANVPDSAASASSAVAQLNVRTGSTGVALEQLSTQVLTLSRITKSDLNATVTDSAKVFQSWGIAAGQQSATLDMVLRASQQTGVGVGTLLQTMVTAGPVFRAAGYDFATSAALIGGFEKAGVNGQRALASLTAAFRFFSKEGIDVQKGVRDTIARIQELGPGAQASALGVKVFGRSAVDMIAAIQSGRLDVDALAKSVSTGSETIASAAKATDGFTESLSILRNRATQALEPFGTAILGTFNVALQGVLEPSRQLLSTLDLLAKGAIALSVAMGTHMVASALTATRAFLGSILVTRAQAIATYHNSAASVASARASVAHAEAQLVLARAMGPTTAGVVAQDAALATLAAANIQAAAAETAHGAALSGLTLRARAATAAMTALRGVLAFFGGPIGLAITVALTAIGVAFYNSGRKAREAAAEAKRAAEEYRAALTSMGDAEIASAGARATRILTVQARATQAIRDEMAAQQNILNGINAATKDRGHMTAKEARRAAEVSDLMRENQRRLAQSAALESRWTDRVKETNAEYFRRKQMMDAINTGDTGNGSGPLPWEGDNKDGEKWWQKLASQAQSVRGIFEALRAQQQDTTSAGDALANVLRVAQDRVAGLGNAVTGELAEARSTLLKLISDLQSIDGLGFTVRMAVPGATATSAGGGDPFTARGNNLIRNQVAAGAQAEYWKVEESRQVMRANASREERGVLYTFGDLAKRVAEAGERAAKLWGSLFEGAPRQIQAFMEAFLATRESRAVRVRSGDAIRPVFGADVLSSLSSLVSSALSPVASMLSSAFAAAKKSALGGAVSSVGDAVGSVITAPVPAAAAFVLAMEAMAPVLEALQPAFDALMVPVQMLAEAFGPLLTSLIKAFFPILKILMVGFTYTAQVIGYVGGAIFKVVGEVVAAIGDLISRVPGLGEEGQAIERFGRGLVGTSSELFALAEAMPGIRDEIRALEWADAMDRVADGANRAARAMVNMVEGFKVAQHRFAASAASGQSGDKGGAAGGKTNPVYRIAQQQIEAQSFQLAALNQQWQGVVDRVREVRVEEAELASQRARMAAPNTGDPARLDAANVALSRMSEVAQSRLSSLGSAMTEQFSTARTVLQGLLEDLSDVGGMAFTVHASLVPAPQQRIIPPVSPTPRQQRTGGSGAGTATREPVQQTIVQNFNLENVTLQVAPGEDIPLLWARLRAHMDQQAKSQPSTRATVASLPR